MSGNPKQPATVGPQTQRYTTSPLDNSTLHTEAENASLLSKAIARDWNDSFRQGTDYSVGNQQGPYAPQAQGPNQGPSLRGIQQSGPPNQASTPPTDIKVQSLPTNTQMNHMFVQSQVQRPAQQFYGRTPGPPNQAQRMSSNQHNRQQQQQLYAAQPQFLLQSPMYITPTNAMQFPYANQRPSNFVQPSLPIQYAGQPIAAASYPSFPNPQQVQQPSFFYSQPIMSRTPVPQPAPAPANPTQASIQNVPIVAPAHPQHQPFGGAGRRPSRNTKREHAIPIVNPATGQDISNEIYDEENQPPSGDSSARQTPQPATEQTASKKEIQAMFAKQLSEDQQQPQQQQQQQQPLHAYHPHHPPNGPIEPPPGVGVPMVGPIGGGLIDRGAEPPPQPQQHYNVVPPHHQTQQPVGQPSVRYDSNIVQSSNLHINAKEFVSSSKTKETPIVSANSDAAEVIIPNKSSKDRESPVKARRQTSREHKEPTLLSKDPPKVIENVVVCDNKIAASQVVKDDSKKETTSQAASVVATSINAAPAPGFQTAAVPPSGRDPKDAPTPPTSILSSTPPFPVSDKRNVKKGVSPSAGDAVKVPNVADNVPIESITVTPSAAAVGGGAPPQMVQENINAKSKHNAQRNVKHAPSSQPSNHAKQPQQQQQQQQPAVVVPPPQPARPNNKTNKKSELNLKGANKEGTDMDAFNDNSAAKEEVNANIVNSVVNASTNQNDVVNANSIAPPPVNAPATVTSATTPASVTTTPKPTVIDNANVCNIESKKIESNDNVTIKPTTVDQPLPPSFQQSQQQQQPQIPPSNRIESQTITATTIIAPKPLVKAKEGFDVTNIVREQPKPMKPFVPPVQPQNVVDSQDETDRSALAADKLVMAKNDVNAKGYSNSEADQKLKLNYKTGYWSPSCPDGLKIYDRDFLMILKELPASNLKPDNIPDAIIVDERHRISDGRLSMGGRTDFINPPFTGYGGKSGSQRGATIAKRNSQTGKVGSRGDKGAPKPEQNRLKISLSLRGEVKLHESDNAWRPARFNVTATMTDDEKKTQLLYKKVRSVLNKLTPQKFDTLVSQVRELQIDSKARLQGVIDLVFEKAIDEPSFSEAYALMCKELQAMQAPSQDDKKSIQFRTLLVTRCQQEFEKQSVDETTRAKKVEEIEECSDAEKKKDLEFELEEYDRRLRMRSVGTIRFIGELFKQHMLTASIMRRCLQTLLDNGDEESLECLCKLLTTVGKELETKNVDLASFFREMRDISDGKRGKISSRIRFMLQDVIDLKDSKWVPRRQDLNPKTIDQITKEAETEQMNIQAMNSVPMTPRKDDRGGAGGGGGPRQNRNKNNMSDDGWSSVGSRNSRTPFSIQTDKLRQNKMPLADEPLGSSQVFSNWGKGSTVKSQQPSLGPSNNIFSALENIESQDKRPLSSRGKEPYSSKGPSLERSTYNRYDGRGSRSGSQHRSDVGPASTPQRSMGGPPPPQVVPMSRPAAPPMVSPATLPPPQPQQQQQQQSQQATLPPPNVPKLTEEQIERRVNNSLDEYLNDSCTPDDYFQEISSTVPPSYYSRLVGDSYLRVTEKSTSARRKTSCLFANLINSGKLPLEDFCTGFEDLLSQAEDLEIDIPRIWEYIAEELVDLICQEALPLERLQKFLSGLRRHAPKVLVHLFRLIVSDKGPNFLHSIWQKSGLKLSDFMAEHDVEPFVQDNKLEFLIGGDAPVGQCQLSYEQIQSKLSEFLRSKTAFDDIVNWISANVGKRIEDNKVIRTLANAIFENSITKNKLVPETLKEHYRLIQKYVDNNPNYELHCLFALQSLVHKLEHPQGLLLSIFNRLYEDNVFSQESFIAYQNSNDPAAEQEGKGVALKQLTSFFTQLMENEDDEYGSSTSDDA